MYKVILNRDETRLWRLAATRNCSYEYRKMAEDISDEYMCYNTACRKTSGNPNEILEHTIFNHHSAEQFRIRKKILDPNSGYGGHQSIHFGIEISELAKRVNGGFKPRLDIISNKISFKRPSQTISSSSTTTTSFNVFDDKKQSKEVQTIDNEVYQFIPGAIEKLKEMGRLDDFISVLNAIATGKIVENIALHLLLDVGSFLSKPTIFNTRYSDQTIAFWITVKKLFKGKGVNFFRGFKGEGTKSVFPIKPEECRINFAVPSDSVLLNESQKYTADAGTQGILKSALDSYAHKLAIEKDRYLNINKNNRFCKLCNTQEIEDEILFLMHCPSYTVERANLFSEVEKLCSNFQHLDVTNKFIWLLSCENENICNILASYTKKCFQIRETVSRL